MMTTPQSLVAAAAAGCSVQLRLSACAALSADHTRSRCLSVLSWGRNAEHQCAVEGGTPLILQPTVVLELLQQPVLSLAAGKLNSAAVVGEAAAGSSDDARHVYGWGDGSCGKLGLGSGRNVASPSRVEAFVGRSSIQSVSLGHDHSLFLDAGGGLWACGENKEGQLGLGTSLAELASQHRQAYQQSMSPLEAAVMQSGLSPDRFAQQLRAAAEAASTATPTAHGWGSLGSSWGRSSQDSGGGGWAAGAAAPSNSSSSGGSSSRGRNSWLSGPGAGGRRGSRHWQQQSSHVGSISSTGFWRSSDQDLQAHLHALQMHPGQTHTPVRVGCAYSPSLLLQQQAASEDGSSSSVDEDGSSSTTAAAGGLAAERVISVAASKYFSVAATASGEVWTCGADFNGGLGSAEASWQTSAARVCGPISEALAARGGAVAVAAGSTFTAALTASGRVLVWGQLVSHSSGSSTSRRRQQQQEPPASADADGVPRSSWCEVVLPPGVHVQHIAAGQQHLLLASGGRVWAVGRWLDAHGQEVGAAGCEAPVEVLSLAHPVTKLSAGMHSSGVVDAAGRLHLWGRLLDEIHARAVTRGVAYVGAARGAAAGAAMAAAAAAEQRLAHVDWGWAGFGGAAPRLVEGLEGVRDVALGGFHALVLVD